MIIRRSIKAAKELLEGDEEKQAMIDKAFSQMQLLKPRYEEMIKGESQATLPKVRA